MEPKSLIHFYFYPRPLRGGRHHRAAAGRLGQVISIHALCEEGDHLIADHQVCPVAISIHALCEEGDGNVPCRRWRSIYFYPRPLRGGRPELKDQMDDLDDISIHALCEEGDRCVELRMFMCSIFLSTPSARRATPRLLPVLPCPIISIHALCEEGDYMDDVTIYAAAKFLSTPSARRATAKTETKSLFSNKLYNILHEFRRALIYNGSKSYPNHAK